MTGGRGTASRRTVLRAAAAAGLSTIAGGCSAGDRPIQVAVVWSSTELARFREVLRSVPVKVISAGNDIDAFLRARHLAGTSPDIAILPQPGLLTDYADRGWLAKLPADLDDPFPQYWRSLLKVGGGLYGIWVKAAFKSLFWYKPSIVDSPPQTWDELLNLVRGMGETALSSEGGPAPLAIGAADGWVLTDWLENVLASLGPDLYDKLARGESSWTDSGVRHSLKLLAQLWSVPGAFVGGPGRALLTQFNESVIQVTSGQAAMMYGADFIQSVAADFQETGAPTLRTFWFPTVKNGTPPLVVGGDAAVVLRWSQGCENLLRYLIEPKSFQPWMDAGGYLSPNSYIRSESYPKDGLARGLAKKLDEAVGSGAHLRFDLSDQMPGSFGGADGVGMWKILQDFFRAVTAPGADPGRAIDDTVRQLDRAAHQARDNQ